MERTAGPGGGRRVGIGIGALEGNVGDIIGTRGVWGGGRVASHCYVNTQRTRHAAVSQASAANGGGSVEVDRIQRT